MSGKYGGRGEELGIFLLFFGINSNRIIFSIRRIKMSKMIKIVLEMTKVLLIFVICTLLFYYVIKALHQEYEQLDRYEMPKGNAVEVFEQEENDLLERISIFFRLGE